MKTSKTRTATGATEDKHSARLGNHMPRAEPECAYLENEPDEKKINGWRPFESEGLTQQGHFFHITALMIVRPRSSYYRRVSVTFSDQAGKEFLHA
ncbi:hypothetical protein [Pseudomonas brassicacearum]|uniref:hypothetical protein n=1 Tax=Pseudomonas brassicacearum TaxID=930166 RepID=UPI0011CD7EF3|nr:hypothetical protein [Pseudomonas brassicacearum]